LVAIAFERMATGRFTQREVLDHITSLGLRTRRGLTLSKQKFSAMLVNPLYAGRVVKADWDVDVRGDFEPIVSAEVFQAVQDVLSGRRAAKPSRSLDNPEFPLRRAVLCGKCLAPMTGSGSKGRGGKRYPYYHCRTEGCGVPSISVAAFHEAFEFLLRRHVVRPELGRLFEAVVEDAWRDRTEHVRASRSRLDARLKELQAREDSLVDKFTQGNGLTEEAFKRQMVRIESDRSTTFEQMTSEQEVELDLPATLAFAIGILEDLPGVWNRLDDELKPKFVRALYPEGLICSDGSIGTAQTPWALTVFPTAPDDVSALAPPTGFEPVLPP
jgi:hypothetical protein